MIRPGQMTLRRILAVNLCIASLVTGVFGTGLLSGANRAFEDALYQQPVPLDGSVVVIGVDSASLEQVGAWPWDRSVMAEVLTLLNRDTEHRPAAIGLDVIYSGPTAPESDTALALAASAGNVAVACTGEFESRLIREGDGNAYMDDSKPTSLLYPYEELARTALVGHTNAMYDTDGVLRHHLWSIGDGQGGVIPSLPYRLYTLYCEYWGLPADFSPPRSAQGFWYVNFSARPGTYLEYSVADILNGDFDPPALAGAAVLIGPYDMGLSDDFVTASDHAERMYGVEYLANVLTAMLQGAGKLEGGQMLQLAALFLLCFLVGMACFLLPLGWAFLLYLLSAGGSVWGCLLIYRAGILLHPLWLPVGVSLGFLASVAEHYYTALREKRNIRSTFQRYVDPMILEELLKEEINALELGGRTVDIAVLFVDLRDFTTLSEGMAPERVVEILNEYLSMTSRCIHQNGGTLDKFVGDCTMAFWGAPLPCADPVYQACRAAMDIRDTAESLSRSISQKYGVPAQFGVGVHYGPAVVGNIGATERMDYTAIGDTVNTASRLESAAPAGTIYISRTVADFLGDRGSATSLGSSVHLKGKSKDFEILILDKLKETTEKGHDTK
ncbi:MAG: adenylate/guanylate cyclase domain-containing protein [Clostridia bacterium]|nr:adenylate/guanylate cyclase domain-containing protein [Clostridia bacterium]